jgi:hypothetical protein
MQVQMKCLVLQMCHLTFSNFVLLDADVFQLNVDASGVVPQISVIMVSPSLIL